MSAIVTALSLLAALFMGGSIARSGACYVEQRITAAVEEDEAAAHFRLRLLLSFERDDDGQITITGFRDCEEE